jgi:hypothetical protein
MNFVDRMVRRASPEPAHLPMLAGIEATLRMLDGEDISRQPIIGRPSRRRGARQWQRRIPTASMSGLISMCRAPAPR